MKEAEPMALEQIAAASAAEKIGWLGLLGGFFVAFWRVVRWLARLEQAAEIAKEERAEMLAEMRGLRSDFNKVLNRLIDRTYYRSPEE